MAGGSDNWPLTSHNASAMDLHGAYDKDCAEATKGITQQQMTQLQKLVPKTIWPKVS